MSYARTAYLVALALVALLLGGCGPRWQVVRAAHPSPFGLQKDYAVLPVDFAGLQVGDKPEADYLAEKDAETREHFRGDKVAINHRYAARLAEAAAEHGIRVGLATGPQSAPFLIRPHARFIEPGFFAGVASGASQLEMTVQITTQDGQILDEIMVTHRTGGSIALASSGQRLRKDAEALGEFTADYLRVRVFGDD